MDKSTQAKLIVLLVIVYALALLFGLLLVAGYHDAPRDALQLAPKEGHSGHQ